MSTEHNLPPENLPLTAPEDSGGRIFLNWVLVALGFGGVALAGAILPDLM